ncbi:TPA: hypothetical protein I8649_002001 [Legionella pneumophila]|nr:hypothetical protein [Legionella pneumophila]
MIKCLPESVIKSSGIRKHRIRNESDLQAHIDYIHFTPVKHGYVATAKEWLYSSFNRYVQSGLLEENWGGVVVRGEFGE